jgi:class 3 adenylate cyclase
MMRSTSRLFSENKPEYFSALDDFGVSDQTISNIREFDTTVIMQPVASSSVENALNEQSGTHVSTNYLGQRVLSSYAPLDIEGLNWAIVSEIAEKEAFKPIVDLQRNILIWSVVLVLGVAFLSILMSKYFVRPIEILAKGVNEATRSDSRVTIDIRSDDEFGKLARQFNSMSERIHSQKNTIEEKNTENDLLLENLLPKPIVDRFRSDEPIADQLQQVSVVHMKISDINALSTLSGIEKSTEILSLIFDSFDDAAERNELERIKTTANSFVAACGLNNSRLDHAKRALEFSMASLSILQRINKDHGLQLSLQIGVDSGSVIAAIVGENRFHYEIWGDTVDTANTIHDLAGANSIVLSKNVYERVSELYPINQIDHALSEEQLYQVDLAKRLDTSTSAPVAS